MSGQEQLKLNKKKTAGAGEDTGNEDLTGQLPDINQLMKRLNRSINKRESECSDNTGLCEWRSVCNFNDCPRK